MTTPQQKIIRKPAPEPDATSNSQAMNLPSRSQPSQPPHEAFQNVQRPSPHQYGIMPGTPEGRWPPPAAQAYPPPNLSSAPARLAQPVNHPYQDSLVQPSGTESYQTYQPVPYAGPWRPQPPADQERKSNGQRQLVQQGERGRIAENPATGRPINYDPRIASHNEGQYRQVIESNGPGRPTSYDPRLMSRQSAQVYPAPGPLELSQGSNRDLGLAPHQAGNQRRISEDSGSRRPASNDPRLLPHQDGRPRRVSESIGLSSRPNYDPKQVPYQGVPQYQVVENMRTNNTAQRNVLAPVPAPVTPQYGPQRTSNYLPPSKPSDVNQQQRSGPPAPHAQPQPPQNPPVAQGVSRPPIPQAYRSTSQPPVSRNIGQPSPQSKKIHKPSQQDINVPQLPQSPDPSPRTSPALNGRGRSGSLAAPPPFGDISLPHNASSRPGSYHSDAGSSDGKGGKRKSWLPGRSRQASQDMSAVSNAPGAWVIGGPNKISYNMEPLLSARKVSELWDDSADTFVYLFPEESRRGPSFRVPSVVISSSPKLRVLAFGHSKGSLRGRAKSFDGRSTLSAIDATRYTNINKPATPPYTPTVSSQDNQTSSDGYAESISSLGESVKESHLYFPFNANNISQNTQQFSQEHDRLVSVRNLFAFLMGRPLVATKNTPSLFSVLCVIANNLKILEFSNVDGSTYGEAVTSSLKYYVNNFGLKDVTNSREKTLEGIVLGERLRSMDLYNEAFAHAAGKYNEVVDMKSPIWDLITPDTRNRLERASMDLKQRQHSVQLRLNEFEFPSLFAGFAASTSSAASNLVRFKAWKSSFLTLRRHVLSYYKDLYGDWPPKAKSKKNKFSVSGLNRLVLKTLYADFCTLYDLLVDRESLTNRSLDVQDAIPEGESEAELAILALRKIESEYDHSSPPVQPPVPFDTPKVPTIATLDPRHHEKSRQESDTRKLHTHETILILTKSHNLDSDFPTPFLKAFRALEEKEGKGKTARDLADQRYGYWLFIYVVLQAFPMLVMDAPGLQSTDGVEYFLCQPPKGGAPWMEDANVMKRAFYRVAGSSGVVALPSDVVDHGVEAIYRRSHCWVAAEKWLEAGHCPPILDGDQQTSNSNRNGDDVNPRRLSLQRDPPVTVSGRFEERSLERQGRTLSIVAESVAGSPINERDTLGLPNQFPSNNRQRARSASNSRRSIAFGLEQLPFPPGYSVSPQSSPHLSPNLGARGRSSTNLDRLPDDRGLGIGISVDTLPTSTTGAGDAESNSQEKSFDDILSSLEQEKGKKDNKTRRKSYMNLVGL